MPFRTSDPTPPRAGLGVSTVLRRSLISYVVGSVSILLVVGLASVWVARDIASQAALRDATLRGGIFARSIVGPLMAKSLVGGHVMPNSALDQVLRTRLQDGSVAHIKLWDSSGRVLWADAPDLVGRSFSLDPDALALFSTPGVVGDISQLDHAENVGDTAAGTSELLEVYASAAIPEGPNVVVETYWSVQRIDDAQWALMRDLLPLVLGGPLLLQLAMFPLSMSLARRVDRGLAERGAMMRHALSASELERHRIAAQLHDGVIQDLSGIGFALPTIAAGLAPSATSARTLLKETHTLLLRDVDSLRTMLTELYPSDLAGGQLPEAVDGLAFRAEREGVTASVHIATPTGESPAVVRMAYRILREGVQNVLKHAHASHMELSAGPDGSDYVVRVADDGVGLPPGASDDGHMGLQLLGATLVDLGGRLSVSPRSPTGTVLVARFPVSLTEISVPAPPPVAGGLRRLVRLRKKFSRWAGEDRGSRPSPDGGFP